MIRIAFRSISRLDLTSAKTKLANLRHANEAVNEVAKSQGCRYVLRMGPEEDYPKSKSEWLNRNSEQRLFLRIILWDESLVTQIPKEKARCVICVHTPFCVHNKNRKIWWL